MTIIKKVAIIGSRDFKNKELLDSTMKKLQENIIMATWEHLGKMRQRILN